MDSRVPCDETQTNEAAVKELESNKLKSFKAVSPGPPSSGRGQRRSVARQLLPVQVTSAQSERDFSRAGQIRTAAKRALLSAAKVSQIKLLESAAANGLIKC